jgi:alginate export protein
MDTKRFSRWRAYLNRGGMVVEVAVSLGVILLPTLGAAELLCPAPPPPFLSLRYDENYQFMRDPACHVDFWDPIKYIRLNEAGDYYLTLGGEVRERYQYYRNNLWGQGPQDPSGYLLQRYMLHADLELGEHVRFFGQVLSALENGQQGGPPPNDEDKLSLHQAFVDLRGSVSDAALTLRVGRQEFSYGSERLISIREGPNVRLSFDAVRMIVKYDEWRVDGFVGRPVQTQAGFFVDGSDHTQALWGVYATGPLPILPAGNVDLYYLGYDRQNATFNQGTANEQRQTIGTRLWGQPGNWDYNAEFLFQFGRFGAGNIQAWVASSDTGYTFKSLPLQPRLGLRAEINSGDRNPNNSNLQTFNALYPRASYFGEIATIGPANLTDLHPALDLHFPHGVTFTLDWDWFWRENSQDGVYSPGGGLLRASTGSSARYVGNQIETQVAWQINRHLSLVANYTHFFAGTFLQQTGPSQDIDFVAAWVQYKF